MDLKEDIFVYENLVSSYRNNLEVQTRGFNPGHIWLESWVPDDDVLPSLLNLVEAAQLGGLNTLKLQIEKESLIPLDIDSLTSHLSHLASVTVIPKQDEICIFLSDLQKAVLFSDIREYYRASLRERHGHFRFAAEPKRATASNIFIFENSEGKFWLEASDGGKKIVGAGFLPSKVATPSFAAAMDYLCEIIIGLPLIEVREHAIVRLEYRIRNKIKTPTGSGIILPQNADPIFLKIRNLLDGLLREADGFDIRETNFLNPGPSVNWKNMSPEQRQVSCQVTADNASVGLLGYSKAIHVVDASKPYAVTVSFKGDASVASKRKAALDLEKLLRKNCDPRLEVFCLEMKDSSQLRRL
jgi:hypothetical protein